MELAVGSEIAGKYRIDGTLGKGGMGVVYAAFHLKLEQKVAIKLMLPEAVERQGGMSRFLREARAAAQIKSEHVARVFDIGTLDTGQPYMVMEFLEGQDVASAIALRGKLAPEVAVGFILQACEAVAEAHAGRIVHRDLKPANLFLLRRMDGSEHVKVLDFGISKFSRHAGEQSDETVTSTSSLMGSPLYMSPEQLRSSRDVDARSDIWSLGVVLYQMLTGGAPFTAATLPQVCENVMHGAIEPPSARAPGIPVELDDVVLRCLERPLELRYASVLELARALEPFGGRAAQHSLERILRMPAAQTLESEWLGSATMDTRGTLSSASPSLRPPVSASSSKLWLAAGLLILALPVGFLVARRDAPPRESSAAAVAASGVAVASPARAAAGGKPSSAGALAASPGSESAASVVPPPGEEPAVTQQRASAKPARAGQLGAVLRANGAAPAPSGTPPEDPTRVGLGEPGERSRL